MKEGAQQGKYSTLKICSANAIGSRQIFLNKENKYLWPDTGLELLFTCAPAKLYILLKSFLQNKRRGTRNNRLAEGIDLSIGYREKKWKKEEKTQNIYL